MKPLPLAGQPSSPVRIVAVVVNYGTPMQAATAARSTVEGARRADAVVVVDNGGADADLLATALPFARVVATPRNLGFAGGANVGLRAALADGADAVLLVNSDAALAPEALARLAEALRPPVGIVGPALVRARDGRLESLGLDVSPGGGRIVEVARGAPPSLAGGPPRRVAAVSGAVMLLSRAALEVTGGFDERFFLYVEDVDLCLRAARAGLHTVVAPEARARHEGAASAGRDNPARLYYTARNHLLLAQGQGAGRGTLLAAAGRELWRAARLAPRSGLAGVRAAAAGVLDHARGRTGAR